MNTRDVIYTFVSYPVRKPLSTDQCLIPSRSPSEADLMIRIQSSTNLAEKLRLAPKSNRISCKSQKTWICVQCVARCLCKPRQVRFTTHTQCIGIKKRPICHMAHRSNNVQSMFNYNQSIYQTTQQYKYNKTILSQRTSPILP